jgi:septal ring factor EnvC (AmiA/AmiB activator)
MTTEAWVILSSVGGFLLAIIIYLTNKMASVRREGVDKGKILEEIKRLFQTLDEMKTDFKQQNKTCQEHALTNAKMEFKIKAIEEKVTEIEVDIRKLKGGK